MNSKNRSILRNIYIPVYLLLLGISELFAYYLADEDVYSSWCERWENGLYGISSYYWLSAFLVLFVMITVKLTRNRNNKFSVSLVYRFLNNSLGNKVWACIFLFVFIIHISWLSDTFLNFFVTREDGFVPIIISIIGTIFLLSGFPMKDVSHEDKDANLLVSGVSYLGDIFFDLLTKAFEKYNCIDKVILLLSREVFDKKSVEKLSIPSAEAELFKKAVYDYNDCSAEQKESAYRTLEKSFKELMKSEIVKKNSLYLEKPIEFCFTERVDYDDFDSCFKAMDKKLNEEEDSSTGTLVYISPGTKTVSGVLTMFGIKSNRTLIYATQNKNAKDQIKCFYNANSNKLQDLIEDLHQDI